MKDVYYNLPEERFYNLTLEKTLRPENGFDSTDLLQKIKQTDNKLDKIANDHTITPAKKMLLSKEVYLKDGGEIVSKVVNTLAKYKEAYEKNNENLEVNRLRKDSLSADQKALLPLVKEQYTSNDKISDNENYNRALVFLADNGLINNRVLKSINARTPKEVIDMSSKINTTIDFLDNAGVDYVNLIEKYNNDKNIKNIEQNVYVG